MQTQTIIHFANIFERANFSKLFTSSSRIKKLTPNFCLMDKCTTAETYVIRKHCPNRKITTKKIHNKRTTYTEWRP